jgi:hypothetical protein
MNDYYEPEDDHRIVAIHKPEPKWDSEYVAMWLITICAVAMFFCLIF